MNKPGLAAAVTADWAGLANRPEGEAVRRIGVIDVGSNSVRLVVFDGVARSPAYFYNEKIMCGLGRGLGETGHLDPEGRLRALNAIRRFSALARAMELTALTGVATAAVRDAKDGAAFVQDVQATTGLALHVASGEEEAELSAKGVLLGWPQGNGVVCDIGGASMELAMLSEGNLGARATSPLGPLRVGEVTGKARTKLIQKEVKKIVEAVAAKGTRRVFLVGGSWRAIAKLDMHRRGYPLRVLHEYRIPRADIAKTASWVRDTPIEELVDLTDTSTSRLELLPRACEVLLALIEEIAPEEVAISSYGLREGLLYEHMPPSLRARDPLLEAAWHMEMSRARFPGFGASLYTWLGPLYTREDRETLRLIRAACHLHDITWRAHPDYRAEVCFETVTRANLSGLDHEGRVFLGIAILTRYKGNPRDTLPEGLEELLSPERARLAQELGRAIRLGAMLSGAAPGSLENTEICETETEVELKLRGPAQALAGEAVERRLNALAQRRGRTGVITLV